MEEKDLWVTMPIIRNFILCTAATSREVEHLCGCIGLSPRDLENSEAKIGLDLNCKLMQEAIKMSGDPLLGLHVGEITSATVLGATGHLIQCSKDALTALKSIQQFTSAFTKQYNYTIEEIGDQVNYYCEPLDIWNSISPLTARHSVDLSFATAVRNLSAITGKTIRPSKMTYIYPKVSNLSEYKRVFSCLPEFNQPRNCITFRRKDLMHPVVGYNSQLSTVLRGLLEKPPQAQGRTVRDQIRDIIINSDVDKPPTLEEIALQLNSTVRSLQRRLKQEDCQFRKIEEELKYELAKSLLKNPLLSMEEIAATMGYSDRSSFQRAFKKWAGKTPHQFRKT